MTATLTSAVPGRRTVHLATLDDLLAEAERIVEAASARRVQPRGNWSAAQVLWHVGRLEEFSLDGFPFRYPWRYRLVCRLLRLVSWNWLLALAFHPGFHNPPAAAALEPDPAVSLDDAAAYLRRQLGRLRFGERMERPSPAEGPISHEQWIQAHLRHAELHFSFLALE